MLASVQSARAIGGLAGNLTMSTWGGPKRRVHGVLLGWFCAGLLGEMVLGLGQTWPVWAAGGFLTVFFASILDGSNQAIWQVKVAPDVQGRVFATRRLIAWMVSPISYALAGPLADQLLEPAMADGGRLVPLFGWLVGSGTGSGMALLFVLGGLLAALTGLCGYLFPAVREAEDVLADHDAVLAGA
jgi:hypothetical protein